MYIYDIFHLISSQVLLANSTGMIKRKVFPGGDNGSFYYGDFVYTGSQTLGNKRGIILHAFREHSCFQPNAGENMVIGSNQ